MKLRIGYEFNYHFPQPTPCILALNVHSSRVSRSHTPGLYSDKSADTHRRLSRCFGNWCSRIVAPVGPALSVLTLSCTIAACPTRSCPVPASIPVEHLPDDALVFLLASRFCESDRCSISPGSCSGRHRPGWARVQAICDFVHDHIAFGYEHARPTRTASEGYNEGVGVCRDYAHLAIAFCRAMNIPARYCTGYLGDVGTPPPFPPGRLRRLVRGLSRRRTGTFSIRATTSPHRPRADRPRPRRRRRGHHHHLRPQHAGSPSGSGPTRSRKRQIIKQSAEDAISHMLRTRRARNV